MNHYRITILYHWKNLTTTSIIVYKQYPVVYNSDLESILLFEYESSLLPELAETLSHITVENVNYLGQSNVTQTNEQQPGYVIPSINPYEYRTSVQ